MPLTTDILLIAYALLLILTAVIMLLCYRRIREGSREYAKAKAALDGMVLSFNRDLQKHDEKMRDIATQSERGLEENLRTIEEMGAKMLAVNAQLEELTRAKEGLATNYDLLRKNVDDLVTQRSEVLRRIGELESLVKSPTEATETGAEPAIPIRRDRVLASLTETELKILDLLASEGEKSSPEIRGRIALTREHTSRLMKKLYASGYVERVTGRMPYVYRLKKEMEEFLKHQGDVT